jgi:hypothetical protein
VDGWGDTWGLGVRLWAGEAVVLDWVVMSACDSGWVPDVLQEGAVEQAVEVAGALVLYRVMSMRN